MGLLVVATPGCVSGVARWRRRGGLQSCERALCLRGNVDGGITRGADAELEDSVPVLAREVVLVHGVDDILDAVLPLAFEAAHQRSEEAGEVLLANFVAVGRGAQADVGLDLFHKPRELTGFRVHAEPACECKALGHTAEHVRARDDGREHAVCRHERPVLLRAVDECIRKIAVGDGFSGLVGELEQLEPVFAAGGFAGALWAGFEVVLLDHEVGEFVVVEVEFDFVVERLLAVGAKHFLTEELARDVPGFEDDVLLPRFGHVFTLVVAHAAGGGLVGRHHVDDLPDVGACAFDELVDGVGRHFDALAVGNGGDA